MSPGTSDATERHEVEPGFDIAIAPAPGEGRAAKVLLVPEMFGLTDAMLDAARAFAAAGHPTAVPNVFWRARDPGVLDYEGPDRHAAFMRLQALDLDRAADDVNRAASWFARQAPEGGPVVAVGHCIGGRLAVLALPSGPLAGAVSLYGLGISAMGGDLARLTKPASLHYGLADEHVPLPEIAAVEAAADGNPSIAIHRYEGAGHSFCNPNRPMFSPADAALVFERTLRFLHRIGASAATS